MNNSFTAIFILLAYYKYSIRTGNQDNQSNSQRRATLNIITALPNRIMNENPSEFEKKRILLNIQARFHIHCYSVLSGPDGESIKSIDRQLRYHAIVCFFFRRMVFTMYTNTQVKDVQYGTETRVLISRVICRWLQGYSALN